MTFLKNLLIALAIIIITPIFPAFAQVHSGGFIEIKVVDQDGETMSGIWELHQGDSQTGQVVQSGMSDTSLKAHWGTYFLRAQKKVGYDRFEILGSNPQKVEYGSTASFTVVYYKGSPVMTPVVTPVGTKTTVTPVRTSVTVPSDRTPLSGVMPEPRLTATRPPVVTASVTQPKKLATTGPAGLLTLLMGSGLTGALYARRRK